MCSLPNWEIILTLVLNFSQLNFLFGQVGTHEAITDKVIKLRKAHYLPKAVDP